MIKKINTLLQYLFFTLFFLILNGCSKKINNDSIIIPTKIKVEFNDLKNGDLVFVSAQTEDLSGAINRVTKINDKRNFDHVGLIEKTKDSIFVLHAAPKGGSQREEINHFIQSQKNNQLTIYRLSNNHQQSIPNAIATAKKLLGKPYNWEYILNNETLYCSDFIERAFRKDSVFELIPMNFKNPKTGEIDDFWIDFYQKRNLNVPQNQPGTNPNQLAESDKLIEIGPLSLKKE